MLAAAIAVHAPPSGWLVRFPSFGGAASIRATFVAYDHAVGTGALGAEDAVARAGGGWAPTGQPGMQVAVSARQQGWAVPVA